MNKWVAQWREEFIEELKLAGEGLSKEEKEALEEEPTVDDGPGGGTDDGPEAVQMMDLEAVQMMDLEKKI